ncbi:hypothetical protein OK074_4688 [Actinobacteria bacterium OK074]|nr:hypothetical protein OK074_4688 [Actinobacteria bacterium OK074]
MTTGPVDTPARAYGPVALVFGIVAAVSAAFLGIAGIGIPVLAGALAVTFGVLGLNHNLRRAQCVVGIVTGAAGALYVIALLSAF